MTPDTEKKTPLPHSFLALELDERLQIASRSDESEVAAACEPSEQVHSAVDETGPDRLERWRNAAPFDQDRGLFGHKLDSLGVSEETLRSALAETFRVEASSKLGVTWLEVFHDAYRDFADAEPVFATDAQASVDFNLQLAAFNPVLAWGAARLRRELCNRNRCLETSRRFGLALIEAAWLGSIRGQIARMLARTSALELGIAKIEDRLAGETPQERYRNFFEQLRAPERACALWNEYPVLARQLTELMHTSLSVLLEFLDHLQADWETLEEQLADEPLGSLKELLLSQGDSHAGGHGVILAGFASGQRLVYKPRSLGVESHFQDLLRWLNDRSGLPAYRTLKMVNRQNHGWVEYVAHQSCTDPEQMRRFYLRQGGLIALFYALQANDLHSQNLIACGEHPMAIDLETLFHPTPVGEDSHAVDRLLHQAHENSVMKTGILPQRVWSHGGGQGIDISAIGGGESQLAPATTLCWENPGTDEMRVTRDQFEMAAEKNRPTMDTQLPSAFTYRREIEEGFVAMYSTLLQHRQALLAEQGPLSWFEADTVRVILRDTRTYAVLLDESYHPDYLRDALDRDQLFDRLWLRVVHQPHLRKVIASEQADLRRRDIPAFSAQANAVDLRDGQGKIIAGFFRTSGLDAARERLRAMSAEDRTRQLWFVTSSLATLAGEPPAKPPTVTKWSATDAGMPRQAARDAAAAIGKRLQQLSVREGELAAWFGTSFLGESWAVDILGLDLYEGLSGIALFLGYAGELTQDASQTQLAQAGVSTLQAFLREDYQPSGIGGFSGLGGIVYGLAHLGNLWQRQDLHQLAESLCVQHASLIEQDEQLDLVAGAAGFLCGVLSLQAVAPSPQLQAVAQRCGERLLATARRSDGRACWVTASNASQALAGMSHGAAGIAHALLALYRQNPDQRWLDTARDAMAFEQSLFSEVHGNWADRRHRSHAHAANDSGMMAAWCHGAPGIGLARLAALQVMDEVAVRRDIAAAVQATLAGGFGNGHSLCHGDVGNLLFLQQAATQLSDQRLQEQVAGLATELVVSLHSQGCRCGIPLATDTPGLMSGLAGIGWGLLRLAAPERVPNVLILEPPQVRRGN